MLRHLADRGPTLPTHLLMIAETNHRVAVDIFAELENIGTIKKLPPTTKSQAKCFYKITDEGRRLLKWMDEMAGLINV